MDRDEVLRYIYENGCTAREIDCAVSADINLAALKVVHLATLGYNLHTMEMGATFKNNVFLRSLDRLLLFAANCVDGACAIRYLRLSAKLLHHAGFQHKDEYDTPAPAVPWNNRSCCPTPDCRRRLTPYFSAYFIRDYLCRPCLVIYSCS